MSYDLVIVGGGFWGIAAALVAERSGAKVCLLDASLPGAASKAASGYYRPSWYKGEWRAKVELAVEDASLYGVELRRTGAVEHYGHGYTRVINDWHTFDPWAFLALRAPDVREQVVSVGARHVLLEGGNVLDTRHTLVAAGVRTDLLLQRSGLVTVGVAPLWGSGCLLRQRPADGPILLHRINPFKHYAFRPWEGGLGRVGETTEQHPGRRKEYLAKLKATMERYTGGWDEVAVLSGARPVLAQGPTVYQALESVTVATGGGKVGAVLAFWAAREVLRRMR